METRAAKNSRTSTPKSKKQSSKSTKQKVVLKRVSVKKLKDSPTSAAAATKRHVADLLTRGEAREVDEQGNLPLDATHAIVGKDKEGNAIVRRARFKAY